MPLPASAHTDRPWRIHELVPDFRLEDVWALPTPGTRDDFADLVRGATEMDPGNGSSRISRLLWATRWKIGELLGWDDEEKTGIGARVPTLRDRLPDDLRAAPGPDLPHVPFQPLYLLDDEFAAETANQTMHGVLHLGWVPDDSGDGWHGQMAVYVRRNGVLGHAYMAAIMPFRHLIVYPPMLRDVGRRWEERPRG